MPPLREIAPGRLAACHYPILDPGAADMPPQPIAATA
jgi:hypothetical protein